MKKWKIESEDTLRYLSISRLRSFLLASNRIHETLNHDSSTRYSTHIIDKKDPRWEDQRSLVKKLIQEKERLSEEI